MKKKKILIVGGLGEVGQILFNGLNPLYDIYIADLIDEGHVEMEKYIQIDITNFKQLQKKVPKDIDTIINLVGISQQNMTVSHNKFNHMCDVYVLGSYNIFLVSKIHAIRRVIFASTNHVTGYYETNGNSKLNRRITTCDYPLPDSVYGALKLCSELLGYVFTQERSLSVISIRIGTLKNNEKEILKRDKRARRTLLSNRDAINLFTQAIETRINHGVYYGVSDNVNRPWSNESAKSEISYSPSQSANELFE